MIGQDDPSSDDLTQLGDVQGDEFNITNGQNTAGASYDGIVDGPSRGFVFYNGNAKGYYLATNGSYDGGTVKVTYNTVDNTNGPSSHLALTCFATGTLIRTARGDVPVEALAVGDLAVTASGAERPIRWIGHRDIDCRTHPRPHDARPVRVAAHAFGAGLPARDLYLSPGHPVLVGADEDSAGGHLVPVMCLINGTTIERTEADSVTYWHVELDAHDILLAEGLPAESYLDWGDRDFFAEGSDHALMNPDFVVPGLAGRYRPVALDGPVVEAERDRLDGVFAMRLAAACAWPDEVAALAL